MERITLASLGPDDQIALILASPVAGRFISSLIDALEGSALLSSYSIVFGGETAVLRVPGSRNGGEDNSHLLVWHGDVRNPWRVDSKLLPRDGAELRLLACALRTGRLSSAADELPGMKHAA